MCVTIVIPNYNGADYIRECLDSLKLQTYKNFNTIVVDNASTDGSDKIIEDEYEDVQLIRNDKNYGFSKAVNIGIKQSNTPYVILLNNDAMAEYDFVDEMVKGIEHSDKLFSCGAKMIQYNDREKIDDAGDFYTILGFGYQRGLDENVKKYRKSTPIFSACAGAAIYRKEIFDKIGYFDENHFAYLEDIDIGYRAKIFGYKNYYLPKAVVYHIGSASSGERYNKFKIKLAARNSVYVYYKNMPAIQLLINAPFIGIGHFMKYMFFRKKGFEKDYVSGLFEGFKNLDKCTKVEYDEKNLKNYIKIQIQLIESLFAKLKRMLGND